MILIKLGFDTIKLQIEKYSNSSIFIQQCKNKEYTDITKKLNEIILVQGNKYFPRVLRNYQPLTNSLIRILNYVVFITLNEIRLEMIKASPTLQLKSGINIALKLHGYKRYGDIIDYYKQYLAAHKIQKQWRISISNPSYLLCQKRLLTEFAQIS